MGTLGRLMSSLTMFGGNVPVSEMAHCVASYQAMTHTLSRLDDDGARAPSLLAGWTRGHVVTHLSRHADSHVRMLEGLQRGELIPQYTGGGKSRAREIEQGAGRRAAELVADFRRANEALFATWERFPAELWERDVEGIGGRVPARLTAYARWRELEVHHVDLDLGFGADSWPRAFVTTALRRTVLALPARNDGARLPAGRWLLDATDRAFGWLITCDPDGAAPVAITEVPAAEARPADGEVQGLSSALLVWLLGRADAAAAGLVVGGATEVVLTLPALAAES